MGGRHFGDNPSDCFSIHRARETNYFRFLANLAFRLLLLLLHPARHSSDGSFNWLIMLCERCLVLLLHMGDAFDIWTDGSFFCYWDLCAAAPGCEHEYFTMENVLDLLVQLLEQASCKGYLDEDAEAQLLDHMLYFPLCDEPDVITTDPFCLKIVATCVSGRKTAIQVVYRILRSIDTEASNSVPQNSPFWLLKYTEASSSVPQNSPFWLLKCILESLGSEELKKAAGFAIQMLYDALKRLRQFDF
ncbi:unnamed protein product [Gongylonema pulchrum]|uniref:MMS19 nucleotide excision repair protein n=1 Tax=Gongylonema pulchrum TaxID=637853 RepID=A0A183DXP6_9BILA|nr:unnamed protein product [Gongylonema pulchrum]